MINSNSKLISPYGGELIDLFVQGSERSELLEKAASYPDIQLTPRQSQAPFYK